MSKTARICLEIAKLVITAILGYAEGSEQVISSLFGL